MDPKIIQEQFLQVVDNQLAANDPPQTRATLLRLQQQGYSEEDAKKLIATCVASEIFDVVKLDMPFDEERYVRLLNQLPKLPE